MATKGGGKPDISGGRTLSKMRGGKGKDGGGKRMARRQTWFQLAGRKFATQAKLSAWPVGEMPPDVATRLGTKS